METRRKKRRRARGSSVEPAVVDQTLRRPELHEEDVVESVDSDVTPEKSSEVDYCFSHPSHPYSAECKHCQVMLCEMCTFSYQNTEMCGECFERQIKQSHSTSAWRGLLSAVGGFVGVAAFLGYFLLPTVSPIILQLVATFGAGIGIASGLAAQDFKGIGPRAGMTGAALSAVVLVLVLLMHLARIMGIGAEAS